ncbi:rhoptry neck protein 4, putative [Plasmodium relictum]|uniref:Rhoptry neck protein 4, putative n=1 Tax=Plasmodium relictum TaxID=85471 RepID=A0A1J1H518_PLARL|nr:rhoptry neck protein 4, putative [Plasmodium relictum]CRH00028.1 rhoptry neck protein 4, putative [Plasmodium relictum]
MSNIRFFVCIFLVLSTFIDKTKPFKEKGRKFNISFIQEVPQIHSGDSESSADTANTSNTSNTPDTSTPNTPDATSTLDKAHTSDTSTTGKENTLDEPNTPNKSNTPDTSTTDKENTQNESSTPNKENTPDKLNTPDTSTTDKENTPDKLNTPDTSTTDKENTPDTTNTPDKSNTPDTTNTPNKENTSDTSTPYITNIPDIYQNESNIIANPIPLQEERGNDINSNQKHSDSQGHYNQHWDNFNSHKNGDTTGHNSDKHSKGYEQIEKDKYNPTELTIDMHNQDKGNGDKDFHKNESSQYESANNSDKDTEYSKHSLYHYDNTSNDKYNNNDINEEKKQAHYEEKNKVKNRDILNMATNLYQNKDAITLESFEGKGLYSSIMDQIILEIMKCAGEGVKGLLRLKESSVSSSLFKEALSTLNINEEQLSFDPNLLTLEVYDKILSTMFKIMTNMSYYEFPHFYEPLGIDKSILQQSLKQIKIKILRKIGVTYSKLPPIIKEKGGSCPIKDMIISISTRELAQRMAIMFTKWLSPDEYGGVVDFDNNVELNILCSGASIIIQQHKYFQNILGFEADNDHAYLSLIDELLAIDKKYNKDKEYTKLLKKIKKSKAFNYCTKIMRIGGNISSVPFKHENVKKPSTSLIGSLGNLVKAHIQSYYTAIAQRINSYYYYAEKVSKKTCSLKVVSVCTLLHITDTLYHCSDDSGKNIFDFFNLQLNTLNIEGKKILQPLLELSFLNQEKYIHLKEMCDPTSNLVDETITKLLVLLSTESHELLANEFDKRGMDEDYINEEIKQIDEEGENVTEEDEDVENIVSGDL